MNSLFPTPPETEGDRIVQKAYRLWLLTEQVSELLNFKDNDIPYSANEICILSSIIVIREFRKIDSNIEDSENIINHFWKFPAFQISKIRNNFLFRVGNADRLSSTSNTAHSRNEDRIRMAIDNVDKFIKDRDTFYTGLLNDFYGARRVTPFKIVYILFYEPLLHLDYLDLKSDYHEKVNAELMNVMNLRLEYIRDNIFEFFIPILII